MEDKRPAELQGVAMVANVRRICESSLMHNTQKRFDEVLKDLEQERLRFEKSLKELTAAAAYLRSLLPRRRRRRHCTPHRPRKLRDRANRNAP